MRNKEKFMKNNNESSKIAARSRRKSVTSQVGKSRSIARRTIIVKRKIALSWESRNAVRSPRDIRTHSMTFAYTELYVISDGSVGRRLLVEDSRMLSFRFSVYMCVCVSDGIARDTRILLFLKLSREKVLVNLQ